MKKLMCVLLVFVMTVATVFFGGCGIPNGAKALNLLWLQNAADVTSRQKSDTDATVIFVGGIHEYVASTPESLFNFADIVIVATHAKEIRTLITSWAPLEPGGVMGINMETILRFHVLEVVKGNVEPDTEIYVDYLSGKVTLQEYREAYASYGLVGVPRPDITDEEAKNTYIVQQDVKEVPVRFKDNEQRYMLFLYYNSETGRYVAWSGNYGICEVNDEDRVYGLASTAARSGYINVSFYGPGIELAKAKAEAEAAAEVDPQLAYEIKWAREVLLPSLEESVRTGVYPPYSKTQSESPEELLRIAVEQGLYSSWYLLLLFPEE